MILEGETKEVQRVLKASEVVRKRLRQSKEGKRRRRGQVRGNLKKA